MKLRFTFILITIIACITCHAQTTGDTIRVMTLNLHAGHDSSLQQIGLFIKQYTPDFVALQEVDENTHRSYARHQNGRNFINELAYHSGMNGFFGPTINFSGGRYGIGMLSRHWLVSMDNINLPHPNQDMEQRGLLEGTFVMPCGDTIVMACTHLEAFDSLSRAEQGAYLLSHYSRCPNPVVLAGDFNAEPNDPVIHNLSQSWLDCTDSTPTFSSDNPTEKIDYIFVRPDNGKWKVVSSQVIKTVISDHLPVIVTLVFTKDN